MTIPTTTIKQRHTGIILHSGPYPDLRAALEDAATLGIPLNGPDLRNANLGNAALDGIIMKQADLRGANLTGANLSEARFTDCAFVNTVLYGAFFCESILVNCDFSGALCGGTDLAAAQLERNMFSTLSALQMNYNDCRMLRDCAFLDESSRQVALFSRPPVYISGLNQPVIIFDSHVRIGAQIIDRALWIALANDNLPPDERSAAGTAPLRGFIRRHACLLDAIAGRRYE